MYLFYAGLRVLRHLLPKPPLPTPSPLPSLACLLLFGLSKPGTVPLASGTGVLCAPSMVFSGFFPRHTFISQRPISEGSKGGGG